MEINDKNKFFLCSCGSEAILATRFENEEFIYLSFWRQGTYVEKPSLYNRLKIAWRMVVKNDLTVDEIVLDKKGAEELAKYLTEK